MRGRLGRRKFGALLLYFLYFLNFLYFPLQNGV